MIRKEDNLWKGVLSKVFPDFIRFVHPGIDEILDLEAIRLRFFYFCFFTKPATSDDKIFSIFVAANLLS